MIKRNILIALILTLFCSNADVFCYMQDTTKTVITQPEDKRTDFEKFMGKSKDNSSADKNYLLPGGDSLDTQYFTAEQDSAYYRALKTKLPNYTRFWAELMQSGAEIKAMKGQALTPMELAMRNLSVPSNYLVPTAVEITQYQNNILMSQYVPFTPTSMPFGLKVPLNTIGMFLGLAEDVTPTIKYKLDFASDVEVVVYSLQAIVIQTIFKGSQTAGSYSLTWNLRDDKGKKMSPGDYIIEVRIGKYKYVRKRCVI